MNTALDCLCILVAPLPSTPECVRRRRGRIQSGFTVESLGHSSWKAPMRLITQRGFGNPAALRSRPGGKLLSGSRLGARFGRARATSFGLGMHLAAQTVEKGLVPKRFADVILRCVHTSEHGPRPHTRSDLQRVHREDHGSVESSSLGPTCSAKSLQDGLDSRSVTRRWTPSATRVEPPQGRRSPSSTRLSFPRALIATRIARLAASTVLAGPVSFR